MRQRLLGLALASLCASAQSAGFLPVAEAVQPLRQRLQLIAQEMRPLRTLLQQVPASEEPPQAVRERALAWSRLQDLLDEQVRLQGELDEALLAGRDPLRQH